jgi:hypothetical protein
VEKVRVREDLRTKVDVEGSSGEGKGGVGGAGKR